MLKYSAAKPGTPCPGWSFGYRKAAAQLSRLVKRYPLGERVCVCVCGYVMPSSPKFQLSKQHRLLRDCPGGCSIDCNSARGRTNPAGRLSVFCIFYPKTSLPREGCVPVATFFLTHPAKEAELFESEGAKVLRGGAGVRSAGDKTFGQ